MYMSYLDCLLPSRMNKLLYGPHLTPWEMSTADCVCIKHALDRFIAFGQDTG